MRILLVRTSTPARMLVPIVPPLGLLYLASAVREWCQSQTEIRLVHLMKRNYGIDDLRQEITAFRPQMVGLSTLLYEDRTLQDIAATVKAYNSHCWIVVGGPQATLYPQEVLKDKNVDFVVIGEGEKTFAELVDCLALDHSFDKLSGIAYRQSHQIIFNPPRPFISELDEIPFPAWDLIRLEDYLWHPEASNFLAERNYAPIFTSRACPYSCIYCHRIFGKGWRARSPENVI
ncbi:MAG: cobalamin-dependent protein, partial [Candidatus Edwardsbacteria bacterium]